MTKGENDIVFVQIDDIHTFMLPKLIKYSTVKLTGAHRKPVLIVSST